MRNALPSQCIHVQYSPFDASPPRQWHERLRRRVDNRWTLLALRFVSHLGRNGSFEGSMAKRLTQTQSRGKTPSNTVGHTKG